MAQAPSSAITIDVSDGTGNPLFAEVYLEDSLTGNIVAVGERIAPGTYSLGNQPYRDYNVIIRSRGFKPQKIYFYATAATVNIDATMVENTADVLIIDVSTDGDSPTQIHSDLEDAGISSEIRTTFSEFPDISEMWNYNVIIYSAGTNSFSATPSILDALYQYHHSGGRIIFEGGEIAYQVIEEGGFLPLYAEELLHLNSYLSDNPHDEGLVSKSIFRDSLFYSYPEFLNDNVATEHVSFYDYEKFDVVTPSDDAQFLYTTVFDTSQGCIVLFEDSERSGFARSAFCGFTYTEALTNPDDAANIIINLTEKLLPPDNDFGIVYGKIYLAGGFAGSNVEIDADGTYPVVDSSNSDGRYALAAKTGDYSITFRRDDYLDTTFSIAISPENPVRIDVIMTPVGFVHEHKPQKPLIGAPAPNPFNSSVSIEFTNPSGQVVDAQVFDFSGKLVFEKNLGKVKNDSFIWHPDEKSSGVYFIKVSIGDFQSIKKVIYIR